MKRKESSDYVPPSEIQERTGKRKKKEHTEKKEPGIFYLKNKKGEVVKCKVMTKEERNAAIKKYRKKRKNRKYNRTRYELRKEFSKQRPRYKGKFI